MNVEVSSPSEATEQARTIMRYWASRGYRVKAWMVPIQQGFDPDAPFIGYGVKSDLVNGWPREVAERNKEFTS